MKLNIAGKGFTVEDAMRDRLSKKLNKLDKYFYGEAEVTAKLSQEKKTRNIVEITIAAGGLILRAEQASADMYASIDGAIDKLTKQIRRHHAKVENKTRVSIADLPTLADDIAPPTDEIEDIYAIARVKKFAVKPMQVDDAIANMELLDHTFYLFHNEETDKLSVLYRRNDGGYGILQPE